MECRNLTKLISADSAMTCAEREFQGPPPTCLYFLRYAPERAMRALLERTGGRKDFRKDPGP